MAKEWQRSLSLVCCLKPLECVCDPTGCPSKSFKKFKPRSPSGSHNLWREGDHESNWFVWCHSEWQVAIPDLPATTTPNGSTMLHWFCVTSVEVEVLRESASKPKALHPGIPPIFTCATCVGKKQPLGHSFFVVLQGYTSKVTYVATHPSSASTGNSQSLVATMLRVICKRRCRHQGFDLCN